MSDTNAVGSPIKSGWRGNLNGYVEKTQGTHIEVSEITLRLDKDTAYALGNQLTDRAVDANSAYLESDQVQKLKSLGAALGRLIDHHAANNEGRQCVK